MIRTLVMTLAASAFLLSACGEKPQAGANSARKSNVPAWQGTDGSPYAAAGWKTGDQAAWEQQLRNRAQGQNEYTRAGTP